ncbi:MAG TPA: MMPL family transporter [Anaeromyxobacteraceae bacterium]|nr:MMPL family transporter [Anaeromyxobacteraceae bacterium]
MSFPSLIARLTEASLRRWRLFLLAGGVLAVTGVALATRLEIRSSFEELLPEDVPSVRHAKELARRVGGDGTVLVNVEALDGPKDLKAAETLSDELAKAYLSLGPEVIRAVESNVRPVESWYEDHWPLFLSVHDLEKARSEVVEAIGRAKASENPLFHLVDGEDEAKEQTAVKEKFLDPDEKSPRAEVRARFARYLDGYLVHPDHRSVTIVVRPTGTSLGVAEARVVLDKMHAATARYAVEARANHLRVGYGGSFPIFLAEYESIIHDVASTFALVMALVLASILLFYREVRPVLALGGAILLAVAATFGLTWLVIGYLNTQTAFLGSIVAGNGINYGLVYLARVSQLRRRGALLAPACHEGAHAAARATLLAAVGTSVSFGTLLVATNRGFRHFGFIGGVGMVLCWASTFTFLPALLKFFERIHPTRYRRTQAEPTRLASLLSRAFAHPRVVVAVFALLAVLALTLFLRGLPDVMELNLDNLTNEVKGNPELKRDNERANSALGQSIAGVVALLPSRELAEGYCSAIAGRLERQPRLKELIEGCETISSVVPRHQAEKLRLIKDIRSRLTEGVLKRLAPREAARAREIVADLAAQRVLSDAEAPPSLVDRFREHDGTVGRLAFVRAKPLARLELAPNLRDFVAGVRDVPVDGARYDAAGETVVVADLLADIEHEGPNTTLLSFLGVCVLVVFFFRSVARSALLLLSLSVGVALMAGVAALLHIKINFFNFIVYPITFGVAVDYGANVLARMSVRRNVTKALAEVGPAVALCSWTTIIGYGSLIFSLNRALRSFGWYAMLGELTTLITALTLLPAMALIVPSRLWASRGDLEGEEASVPRTKSLEETQDAK